MILKIVLNFLTPVLCTQIYQNCSCVLGGLAAIGVCDYGCSHMYGYVISGGLRLLVTTLGSIPKLIILMRGRGCEKMCGGPVESGWEKGFGGPVEGWLLAPIVFGSLIDNTCLIWDIKCHARGRCLLYDNDMFRLKFQGYAGLFLACSLAFQLIAYVYARCTRCLDTDAKGEDGAPTVEMTLVVNGNATVDA
ncbi:unnamed protein product [Candidula unifasciata]|uniref:Solute carrier organic anion transporter family member 4A1 n=1 Tax=Candidula unifasciata TaxID=100452 RepID=A0A8S3Z182_9EUPU|nr:unnamed protein product [Candidula unifasciata]